MFTRRLTLTIGALALIFSVVLTAQTAEKRKAWNAEQKPFNIYGNTYYVGTHGLSSILITGKDGHVLIDGALPESAPLIAEHIRALGFKMEDVKVILNSHVHFDHAGGIAELQNLSGAMVMASESSTKVLKANAYGHDDPQFGSLDPPTTAAITRIKTVKDKEKIHVCSLELQAHYTPGHTPGGTTWSWRSCDTSTPARCLNIVYADSVSPVSADNFLFTQSPHAMRDFDMTFATLRLIDCDILLTPHPEISDLWTRLEKRDHGNADALIDRVALDTFVDQARENFQKRIADERAKTTPAK